MQEIINTKIISLTRRQRQGTRKVPSTRQRLQKDRVSLLCRTYVFIQDSTDVIVLI